MFGPEGVRDNDRGVLWIKLLDVENVKNGASENMYYKLVCMQNSQLDRRIEQDQIAFRSRLNVNKSQCYQADSTKLTNIIKAYGNQDPELSYSQGYNYIVSLLLLYI